MPPCGTGSDVVDQVTEWEEYRLLAKYALAMVVVLLFQAPCSYAAEPAKNIAQQAWQSALLADRLGQAELRDKLMNQAVEADPGYVPARWHAGHVHYRGAWRSIGQVAQLVSDDPGWQQYQGEARQIGADPDAHAALAHWCRQAGYDDEARMHWSYVLQLRPGDREAIGQLGVKSYRGNYLTPAEIEQAQRSEEQWEAANRDQQRELKRLASQVRRGDEEQSGESLRKISATTDPAAIGPLADLVAEADRKGGAASATAHRKVALAAVTALATIKDQAATEALLEIALLAVQDDLRLAAAEALRQRRPTSYMPLLMAALRRPLEFSATTYVLPTGHVSLYEMIHEEGPVSQATELRQSNYATHEVIGRNQEVYRGSQFRGIRRMPRRVVAYPEQDLAKAASRIAATEAAVIQENLARRERNARVVEVLEVVTGQELGDVPLQWWKAWQQHNELSLSEAATDEQQCYFETWHSYYEPPPARVYERPPPTPRRSRSCFVAGTPVWTKAGPTPIETLQVGDLVLSQDPQTGQLDYRPVVETTIRPPSPVVDLQFGDDRITTTLGHRFWVTNQGWQMAKFLAEGNLLYGVGGSTPLLAVGSAEETRAYNLAVADFHTYFVGTSRLLVHDNTCPQPTWTGVPGGLSDAQPSFANATAAPADR